MTRVEYIRQLEFSLSGKLPRREISEILRDYSEYFEAGKSEGKSEEEIAVSLGIPSAAAAQILSEIEEEKGYKRKMPEPEKTEKEPSPAKNWWEQLKTLFKNLCSFLGGFFEGIRPAAKPASSTGPAPSSGVAASPQAADNQENILHAPKNAYPPPPKRLKWKKAAAPSGKKPKQAPSHSLRSVLLSLLLFPVILLAILFGGSLLAFICFSIILLIGFLIILFLCFLAAAFAGSIAFTVAGGLGMPVSFVLLFIIALLFCLAGSILTICGLCYLMKGLARLIRFCLNSPRWKNAEDSVQTASSPNVYQDGWDAPTPAPSPAPQKEPPFSAYDSSSYSFIYEQPIPEPRLQFAEEPPEETTENREENGHA